MKIVSKSCQLLLIQMSLLLAGSTSTSAQVGPEQTWLEAVPPLLRSSLVARLEQYINYERRREYEKLYTLFDESARKSFSLRTREDYAKTRRNSYPILLSFKPESSGYDDRRGTCEIMGAAELQWKDGITRRLMFIDATLQNGEWYLSQIFEEVANPGGVETLTTTTSPILTIELVPRKLRKPRKNLRRQRILAPHGNPTT